MNIKISTPNKNEFAKFEITLYKEDFNMIVDTAVDGYICHEYDSNLYNHKSVLNAVSKCESFKENVVREILKDLNSLLPEHFFINTGLGDAWEESPVCKKIDQDIKSKKYKNEETREIKEAKKLLDKSGYKISKQ